MFERDKEELRELGIPLDTGQQRPARRGAWLPHPPAAVRAPGHQAGAGRGRRAGLAARVWRRAELAGAAAGALLKLRAAGIDAEETSQPRIEPRLTGEAAFGPLWEAVRDRRPVTFAYRAAGRS